MTRLSPAPFVGMRDYQAGMTQHEGFNKKADVVMAGAVYSTVQSSTHIRARQQLECNGFTWKPKHLQELDLGTFVHKLREMDAVLDYIRRDPFFAHNSAIAYRFSHYVGETRTIHGVIVTDSNYRLLRRFDREDLDIGRNGKSASVLDFCLPYICHQDQPAACAAD